MVLLRDVSGMRVNLLLVQEHDIGHQELSQLQLMFVPMA